MTQPARKKKSRKAADILADGALCIYCSAVATTVEHMPPRMMFKAKDRPSGLEFASCQECNNGTSAADAAAAFFARMDMFGDDPHDWKVREAIKPLQSLGSLTPGFIEEVFDGPETSNTFAETRGGILVPVVKTHTGPITEALLTVFAAKLGMALYKEHVGAPLPATGGVHCMWFLNGGLSEQTAHSFLAILPARETLTQGRRKSASGQFDYRYNCDNKSIFAAFVGFHSNLHFFVLAMATPDIYGFPRPMPHTSMVRPGELLKFMPKPRPVILRPGAILPGTTGLILRP